MGTEGLTRSFGWGAREVCEQQDVQEFARMLCETLQEHANSNPHPKPNPNPNPNPNPSPNPNPNPNPSPNRDP